MNINPTGVVDGNGDPALIYETAFGGNPLNVAAQNNNSTTFDIKSDEGWGIGNQTFKVTVSEGSNSVIESEIYHIGIIDVEICGLTDTDGDGIVDTSVDDDNDGLSDAEEAALGPNPILADTDGDGFDDGAEVAAGSDPLDPESVPSGPAVPALPHFWGALLLLAVLAITREIPRTTKRV